MNGTETKAAYDARHYEIARLREGMQRMEKLMAYTVENFKTKKALKEALASGRTVEVYQPGPFGPDVRDGDFVALEGPHYPEPHRWYASAVVRGGMVVKVK